MNQEGLYIERVTFLHTLDPRIKIIGLFTFFIVPLILKGPFLLSGMLLFLIFLICSSGSLRNLLRIKWLIFIVSGMCILFWLPTKPLLYGAMAAMRLDIMMFAGILFISATRVEEFSAGLTMLGIPYRIAFAVSLSFRLIPTLFLIIQTTVEAQETRGLDVKSGNIVRRAKNYIPLFIPVISLLIRNAHQLSMALESRGFGYKKGRTSYREYAIEARDLMALLALVAMSLLSLSIFLF